MQRRNLDALVLSVLVVAILSIICMSLVVSRAVDQLAGRC